MRKFRFPKSLLTMIVVILIVQLACGLNDLTGGGTNYEATEDALEETQDAIEDAERDATRTQKALDKEEEDKPEPTEPPDEPSEEPSDEPSEEPVIEPPSSSGSYYTDFSDFDTAWEYFVAYTSTGYSIRVQGDGLYVKIPEKNDFFYAFYEFYHTDVVIGLNASLVGGTNYTYITVICRSSDQGQYEFILDTGGFWQIGKWDFVADEYSRLGYGGTAKIKVGKHANLITAICIGPELIMEINGEEVGRAVDYAFDSGIIGIAVSTYDYPTAEVMFYELAAEVIE
jgi:hypothetical protein